MHEITRGLCTSAIAEAVRRVKVPLSPFISLHGIDLPSAQEVEELSNFVRNKKRIVAITGAGASTGSGIPDYRGPQGSYRKGHRPITHTEFLQLEHARQRYWARSMLGWQHFSRASPNDAHISLARLEALGHLHLTVTQNVDRLHQQAGQQHVIDLHGRIDRVTCLACHSKVSRRIFQEVLCDLNPSWQQLITARGDETEHMRADGDVELGEQDFSTVLPLIASSSHLSGVSPLCLQFVPPCCPTCGGMMKPDFVFFGDSVPVDLVEDIHTEVSHPLLGAFLLTCSADREC